MIELQVFVKNNNNNKNIFKTKIKNNNKQKELLSASDWL